MSSPFVSTNTLRETFAASLSRMYRREAPAYGQLVDLVGDINQRVLTDDPALKDRLSRTGDLARLDDERHGAIRLGRPEELAMMRRVLGVMGMLPVGYYDLAAAGLPVHATAFRAASEDDLSASPFRIFCSLLRLDLIADASLRRFAQQSLAQRQIFSDDAIQLTEKAETNGGLTAAEAGLFIDAILPTFAWSPDARISKDRYDALHRSHRLIADIVAFKGPHINHLTPRTLDIDAAQAEMPKRNLPPKAVVEGPPRRDCPILLRQTSFKALEEAVVFPSEQPGAPSQTGVHTARFGEIEQRGAALTPHGRDHYDTLLLQARSAAAPRADGANRADYSHALNMAFASFPDDWNALRRQGLVYCRYRPAPAAGPAPETRDLNALVAAGVLIADPITYEDFLPVSAAGIFQSNLGDQAAESFAAEARQSEFEDALGADVVDPFALYAAQESASIADCFSQLGLPAN